MTVAGRGVGEEGREREKETKIGHSRLCIQRYLQQFLPRHFYIGEPKKIPFIFTFILLLRFLQLTLKNANTVNTQNFQI